jgi:CDP-paratose 2-epimerase
VLDYGAQLGLPAVVFRMSCIYGPRQFGVEDQGWLAHFIIRAIEGEPITIFGDGMQSRDVLYIDDLVNAMLLAQARSDVLSGRVFNIGGGPKNSVSLIELLQLIGERGSSPRLLYKASRPGDQRYYASDTRSFRDATGWYPRTGVREGVGYLYDWLLEARRPAVSVKGGVA